MKVEENSYNKIQVYYDGLCKVCDAEISHYKRQKGSENIVFIDICSGHFDPAKEGLDPVKIHKIMHVRRKDGSLATKMDAFVEIWMNLPKYEILARASKNTLIRHGLDLAYEGFTKIRPWLPRKNAKSDCSDSPYCEIRKV